MALATITPQTASVEILLATVSYKNYFSSARVRSNLPQLDATVFGNEATGDFIAGIERLTIDFGGVLKKGAAAAGPLIPLSGKQGIAFVIEYDGVANQITGTMNFSEAEASMVVGQIRPITASGFSVGTFTVTWAIT
jgi:hypothetical protein